MTAAVATPLRCVVDASVGIKLFLAEALSDQADALFLHLAADPPGEIYVPDLFFIECTNIFWKHIRRSGYPPGKAQGDLADLGALALRIIPTSVLMADALAIAVKETLSAYDACYVALAQHVGVPMVTADEKLARALASAPYAVHWLKDFPIPPLPIRLG